MTFIRKNVSSMWLSLLLQLKEQHKEHSEQRLAIEELERNIQLAEDLCPGITDRMVKHIIDRWEALLCNFTLHPFIWALYSLFPKLPLSDCCFLCLFHLFHQIFEKVRTEVRQNEAFAGGRETVSPRCDAAG